jgi:mRNA interferase MazF
VIRRGDVVWIDFDPVVGSEAGKRRPAVVLQNELANRPSPTVTVIPISSRVGRVYPFQVRIDAGEGGMAREGKALCEQIRTLSRDRIGEALGHLPTHRLRELREALDRQHQGSPPEAASGSVAAGETLLICPLPDATGGPLDCWGVAIPPYRSGQLPRCERGSIWPP